MNAVKEDVEVKCPLIVFMYVNKYVNIAGLKKNVSMQCGIVVVWLL